MKGIATIIWLCATVTTLTTLGEHVSHAAGADIYSVSGAACVPGDPAIQNNRYTINAGSVLHTSTNVDLITLYCAVPVDVVPSGTNPTTLAVTYKDTTGTSTSANVAVQLLAMSKSSAAITTIATFNSNSFSDIVIAQHSVVFSHTFDWVNNTYYIRVDMDRTLTSEIVNLYQVTLK
jgi:hypothetical protein